MNTKFNNGSFLLPIQNGKLGRSILVKSAQIISPIVRNT